MTAPNSLPLHALTEDNLAAASPDLLRVMVKTFTDALMSAEDDAMCNAYGYRRRGGQLNIRLGTEQQAGEPPRTHQRITTAGTSSSWLSSSRSTDCPRRSPRGTLSTRASSASMSTRGGRRRPDSAFASQSVLRPTRPAGTSCVYPRRFL
ncbi:putative transposase [Actinacidiphila reveromycinica]|uniref:Putative transposase n=1 Tax=Actinacidiphila reveromycinica TaxID=659352 RepID=A0A7U3VQZ5_9ACTN|nr:putative transposase [Streptomyces sp. SN-593]